MIIITIFYEFVKYFYHVIPANLLFLTSLPDSSLRHSRFPLRHPRERGYPVRHAAT